MRSVLPVRARLTLSQRPAGKIPFVLQAFCGSSGFGVRTMSAREVANLSMSASAEVSRKKGRSRGVDERSVGARHMRGTHGDVLGHCGGEQYASELKRLRARRIAVLEAELVHMEADFARTRAEGDKPTPADLDLYGRLANGQRRHCEGLGWERTARDVTPDLKTCLDLKSKATEPSDG